MSHNLDTVKNKIHLLKEKIRKEYKAEIIGVFGSYATREQNDNSDLDLLVRFHEGAGLFDLGGLSCFLHEELGVPVDIVSERAVREELREQIYKEAIML